MATFNFGNFQFNSSKILTFSKKYWNHFQFWQFTILPSFSFGYFQAKCLNGVQREEQQPIVWILRSKIRNSRLVKTSDELQFMVNYVNFNENTNVSFNNLELSLHMCLIKLIYSCCAVRCWFFFSFVCNCKRMMHLDSNILFFALLPFLQLHQSKVSRCLYKMHSCILLDRGLNITLYCKIFLITITATMVKWEKNII